jgi:hypothetical protein
MLNNEIRKKKEPPSLLINEEGESYPNFFSL